MLRTCPSSATVPAAITSTPLTCTLTSIRSEEDSDDEVDFSRWSQCGCCMADCPDVHPTPTPGFGPVPGSLVVAEEYVQTLPAQKQEELRELAAGGEIRIARRGEMG